MERLILIISVVIVAVVALISGGILFTKAFLLRKKIKNDQKILIDKELNSSGHKEVLERKDLFEIDLKLKEIFSKSLISDETIEFCVNTIIKNNYEKILVIGNNNPYELLSLIKKTNKQIFYQDSQEDIEIIKEYVFKNNLKNNPILDKKDDKNQFDTILFFNIPNYFQKYFENQDKIKQGGMLIISNIKKDKKQKKDLFNYLIKTKIKFDLLNWDNGFFLILN